MNHLFPEMSIVELYYTDMVLHGFAILVSVGESYQETLWILVCLKMVCIPKMFFFFFFPGNIIFNTGFGGKLQHFQTNPFGIV